MLQEGRELAEEELDLDALVLEDFFFGLNGGDLDGVVGIVLLRQPVVFGPESLADQNSLDLLRILGPYVSGIVAIGSVLAGKVDHSIGRLRSEQLLGNSGVDGLELLSVGRPVRRGQEELPEDLLRAFGDKLGVSEGFVVPVVVDKCSHIDQDLVHCNLVKLRTQGLDGLPWSMLEGPQDDVEEGGRLVGALEVADLGAVPGRLEEVVGVEGLWERKSVEGHLAVQLSEGGGERNVGLAHF